MKDSNLRTTVIGSYPSPGWYEHALSNMSSFEAAQIASTLSLPAEVFTNNWSIVMSNATRSNQKLAYPGFNFIY